MKTPLPATTAPVPKDPMPPAIPISRPSISRGAKSLRAYRRVMDFALEMALAGMISAREAKALAETAKIGADTYLAERQLQHHLVDEEAQDHPLGHDGGAVQIPLGHMVEQRPSDNVGYDTIVPCPEAPEHLEQAIEEAGGVEKVKVGGTNSYPKPKPDDKNFPVPAIRKDANRFMEGYVATPLRSVERSDDDEIEI